MKIKNKPTTLNMVQIIQLLSMVMLSRTSQVPMKDKPNILILIVDDLGIGDLSCFGNTSLSTPNIDRLCREGSRLTHHVATATLCTPSRAAIMTGRYAIRMGMTGVEGSPRVILNTASRVGLPENETTFADIARRSGYRTGLVGKWHLGLNSEFWTDQVHGPLGHGFDYFFGLPLSLLDGMELDPIPVSWSRCINRTRELAILLLCLIPLRMIVSRKVYFSILLLSLLIGWFFLEHFSLTEIVWWSKSDFMEKLFNSFLMENNSVVEKPIQLDNLGDLLTKKSISYIERSVTEGVPFLLFHSFAHVHTPLATSDKFVGESDHGVYGDVMLEMDNSVGRLLATLDILGVSDNTVVYFSSDHGGDHPQVRDLGGYNRPYRGGKSNGALEGGMRVPAIVRWPRVVRPGTEVTQPTSLIDLLPTVAQLVGDLSIDQLKLDGISLLPFLVDNKLKIKRTFFHHCASDVFAVRTAFDDGNTFKMVLKEPELDSNGGCSEFNLKPAGLCPCEGPLVKIHQTPLLYDLVQDPGETNVIDPDSKLYKEVAKEMMDELVRFRNEVDQTKMLSQFTSISRMMPVPWLQPILSV